ncbi:MAG: substrate-binding domain-containing protein, partial [Clostridia bacterium]
VCYNDDIALMLIEQLSQLKLSVPNDISLISFDNSAFAGICHPKLSTLAHPKDAFGQEAAEKLLRMISGSAEKSSCLPWELVMRESIR